MKFSADLCRLLVFMFHVWMSNEMNDASHAYKYAVDNAADEEKKHIQEIIALWLLDEILSNLYQNS